MTYHVIEQTRETESRRGQSVSRRPSVCATTRSGTHRTAPDLQESCTLSEDDQIPIDRLVDDVSVRSLHYADSVVTERVVTESRRTAVFGETRHGGTLRTAHVRTGRTECTGNYRNGVRRRPHTAIAAHRTDGTCVERTEDVIITYRRDDRQKTVRRR